MDEKPYVWDENGVSVPEDGKLEPAYFAHGESLRSLGVWLSCVLFVFAMIGLYISL